MAKCKDVHAHALADLRVPVLEADVESLKPDPDLLIDATFANASGVKYTVRRPSTCKFTTAALGTRSCNRCRSETHHLLPFTRHKRVNWGFAISASSILTCLRLTLEC